MSSSNRETKGDCVCAPGGPDEWATRNPVKDVAARRGLPHVWCADHGWHNAGECPAEDATSPLVENVKRHPGIAGQFSVSALVTYPGESTQAVYFVGNSLGGPVVMVLGEGRQTFVTDPERFGSFASGPLSWVRNFFA